MRYPSFRGHFSQVALLLETSFLKVRSTQISSRSPLSAPHDERHGRRPPGRTRRAEHKLPPRFVRARGGRRHGGRASQRRGGVSDLPDSPSSGRIRRDRRGGRREQTRRRPVLIPGQDVPDRTREGDADVRDAVRARGHAGGLASRAPARVRAARPGRAAGGGHRTRRLGRTFDKPRGRHRRQRFRRRSRRCGRAPRGLHHERVGRCRRLDAGLRVRAERETSGASAAATRARCGDFHRRRRRRRRRAHARFAPRA